MGQVLGFSHCQEFGSVASTPDSTPPCTDGGNEESEMFELQTAREWSDDDEGGDDDETLASSPSIWGTPRQNSYELTFSYFAIAEAEAVGASRHLRDRRRGGSRTGRTPLMRADTLETLLDSPDVDWDPQAFLIQEEDNGVTEGSEQEQEEARTSVPDIGWTDEDQDGQTQTVTVQPFSPNMDSETQGGDAASQRQETESWVTQTVLPPSSSLSAQQPRSVQLTEAASLTSEPESPVVRETISVTLLTSVLPSGSASSSSADLHQKSQEQLVSDQWFSALNQSEVSIDPLRVAVMDLIYWKETERTGMVLTGIVVGLLTLFQLSIITVVSTTSLAVVCVTMAVRIYYHVIHALKWGDGLHPFKAYLDLDVAFTGEQAEQYMQKAIVMTLSAVDCLKKLIFVGNLFDSLKFLVLMYLMTFLGALFNGLTLFIISVIALFSLPLFYQQRKEQVDSVIAKIQAQFDNIRDIFERLARGGGPPPDLTLGGAKPKIQ